MTIYNVVRDGEATRRDITEGNKFNQFPPNMREISPSEFWSRMSAHTPIKIETRAPVVRGDDDYPYSYIWASLNLYYFSEDEGVAFTVNWNPTPKHDGPNDFWPRFFWFGPCRHEWKEISQEEAKKKGVMHHGMCYHVYECQVKNCGKFMSTDSSG